MIVVDEAHNLDDKVRSATTERINQGKLLGLIKSATNEVKPADRQNVYQETNDAQKEIRTFFDCLKAQVQHQINDAKQDMRYAERFFFDSSAESINILKAMVNAIKSAALSIQVYASFDYNNRSMAASDELDELSESLVEMIEELDDYLLWIERKGNQAELVYCPKNTREITNRLYFSGNARTILTSATLTNTTEGSLEDQYAYFISNTGFPTDEHGCLSEPKASPYPYDEHCHLKDELFWCRPITFECHHVPQLLRLFIMVVVCFINRQLHFPKYILRCCFVLLRNLRNDFLKVSHEYSYIFRFYTCSLAQV